jgi:Zn-dependent alcohol dehydrogenase
MENTFPAIVAYEPTKPHTANWKYENIRLARDLEPQELLIKMIGTGICQTDVHYGTEPPATDGTKGVRFPWIMGHEGIGIVHKIGFDVKEHQVGDPVILSYDFCGHCDLCITGRPSYCDEGEIRTVLGAESNCYLTEDGREIRGKFFGQSSFSNFSIVNPASVVNLKGLVDPENKDEMKLLAPLGCGLQTGAGAVMNSGATRNTDIVIIAGLGGVGLGAIMGARIARLKSIIAVDRVESRLQLAKQLGATHTLNTSGLQGDISKSIQEVVNNERISLAIETTGVPSVMNSAMLALGTKGKHIQIAPPPPGFQLSIPPFDLFRKSKVIEGSIQGSVIAKEFVPKMLQW